MGSADLQPDAISYMSLAEAKGYVGLTFLYHHLTDEMVVAWAGNCVEAMVKSDTENSLLDIFQENFHRVKANSMNTDIIKNPSTENLTDIEQQRRSLDAVWRDVCEGSSSELSTLDDGHTDTSNKQDVLVVPECGTAELSQYDDNKGEIMTNCKAITSFESKNRPATTNSSADELGICKCSECGQFFNTQQSMQKHVKADHPNGHNSSTFTDSVKVEDTKLSTQLFVPEMNSLMQVKHTQPAAKKSTHSLIVALKFPKPKKHEGKDVLASALETCPLCHKEFNSKWYLKNHMKMHTGEKAHRCVDCGKSFTFQASLKHHQKTCSTSHCQNRQLKAKNTNGKAKTHPCSRCSKSFCSEAYLKHHVKIHTGEKAHCCVHCGKSFTFQASLRHHLSKVDGCVKKIKPPTPP